MRKLKHHEHKLLKKVDFLQWKNEHNLRELQVRAGGSWWLPGRLAVSPGLSCSRVAAARGLGAHACDVCETHIPPPLANHPQTAPSPDPHSFLLPRLTHPPSRPNPHR